jgi:uncharacterized protein DUF6586
MTRNPYTGPCQQRCVSAGALVEAASAEKTSSALATALLQGAICQLHSAYLLHLREIAENYSLVNSASINTIQQLRDVLIGQNMAPVETGEIKLLAEDSSSWLSQCLSAYEMFQNGLLSQPGVSHGGIDLYQENESSVELNAENIKDWLSSMTELLERHRSLMYEY